MKHRPRRKNRTMMVVAVAGGLVVVGQTTLGPGESTEVSLQFTMHAGMGGPHDFRVALTTNDPRKPERELAVRSHWGP
jgi:hypothetical protein